MNKKNISLILILTLMITTAASSLTVFADTAIEEQQDDATVTIAQEEPEAGADGEGEPQDGNGTGDEAGEGANQGGDGEGTEPGEGGSEGTEPGGDDQDDPQPQPDLKKGPVKENGKWYYYVVSEDGMLSAPKKGTGWIKENGVKKYYLKKGVMVTGWQSIKINSKTTYKYHFGLGKTYAPQVAHGYKVISGKAYYFNNVASSSKYGKMATAVVKNSKGSVLYFPRKDGTLKTGWVAYKGRAYYMFKKTNKSKNRRKGGRAFNYKVNRNITIGKKGYIGGQRGEALAYGINALNKNGWTLKAAYTFSYKLKYANRPYRPKTVAEGAIYGFSKGNGNCYVMNCCFHVMADLMGYNVRQIKASVGPFPHSWLEIKQDGKWWVYDANFRNETGRNGFKIYYGKSGTWRYSRRSSYLKKY